MLGSHHAVGDDGARWGRQAGEQAHGMAAVHDQSLFLCHLTQVMHHQAKLHPHTHTHHQYSSVQTHRYQANWLNTGSLRSYLGPVTKHLPVPSVGDELLGELKDEEKWSCHPDIKNQQKTSEIERAKLIQAVLTWATAGSRLFMIISIMEAAWRVRHGYWSMGWALKKQRETHITAVVEQRN